MIRPIHISLSPNADWDDWKLARSLRFGGETIAGEVKKLESDLESGYGVKAYCLNSGRSALWVALKVSGIEEGDEVLVQGFTCVAVTNSVKWTGAKTVLADIDRETLNMDIKSLEKKITPKTKAVIVQHTFGRMADTAQIIKICKPKNITVIEDMAHIYGEKVHGDLAILSFGRDKALSSVYGGALLVNNENLNKKTQEIIGGLKYPADEWIDKQLNQILFSIPAVYFYNILGLGKILMWGVQKLGLVSMAVYPTEKYGGKPEFFPAKMPDKLALMANFQLGKIQKVNERRKVLGKFYIDSLGLKIPENISWLRFPVRVKNKKEFLDRANDIGIVLGDWFNDVVTPVKDVKACGLDFSGLKEAKKAAEEVINLPTYYYLSTEQAKKVADFVKPWLL